MSFNQLEYINSYSKKNYKTTLIKYRKDSYLNDWINSKLNKNGYILDLIEKDIKENINDVYKLSINVLKDSDNVLIFFGDWLDEFYRSPDSIRQLMINAEPDYNNDFKLYLCCIAATVDKLSNDYKLDKPSWINNPKYIYEKEYFAGETELEDFKEYLRKSTPIEFSSRNLFVSDNILKRN